MSHQKSVDTCYADSETPPCAAPRCGKPAAFDLVDSYGIRTPACRDHYTTIVAAALEEKPAPWASNLIALCAIPGEADPCAIVEELLSLVHPYDRWNLLDELGDAAREPITDIESGENSISGRLGALLERFRDQPDDALTGQAIGKVGQRVVDLWTGSERSTSLAADLKALAHGADLAQVLIREQRRRAGL